MNNYEFEIRNENKNKTNKNKLIRRTPENQKIPAIANLYEFFEQLS